MAVYSPLPVQPPDTVRAALIAVPVPGAAGGARSMSTIRGGLQGYPPDRAARLSPLPMRWASPVRERGVAPMPGIPGMPVAGMPGMPGMPGVAVRSFSPTRQVVRHASPLHIPSRGIVFPGAMPVLRPPLLPDAKQAQGGVPEDWQKRRHFTRTVSPARSPLRRVAPATQATPFMRVGSPTPVQRWVLSHQPVTPVTVALHVKRPSHGGTHPTLLRVNSSEGKEFRWQPPQLPNEPASLKEGQLVAVGKLQLRVGLAIGEGAYAKVFGAIGAETQQEVAIKEMRCGHGAGILPDASLQRATYEVKVMQLLTEASEGEELRVPKLLDHQFWDLAPSEPGAFLCRVAMTRRRGQALISWLEERAACAEQPDGSSSSYCLCFLRAAHSARELLKQLAPTFAKLNGIAMHRDVNARNILVFCPNSALEGGAAPKDTSSLEFTLLDFGSSLDFKAWSSESGEGSWAVENPTGDARYWGPASWVRFLHGPHVMEGGLQKQYSLNLDAFAFAICTLEVIAKLHGHTRLPKEAATGAEAEVELMENIDQFHRAWSRYWNFAVSCFERLAEYSQTVCFGDQQKATQLWEDLSTLEIPSTLQNFLHALCRHLSSLAFQCRRMEDRQWSEAGEVFQVLREMLHEDVSVEWLDISSRLSSSILRVPSPVRQRSEESPQVVHRRSLAEAASMAFSAVTAGLFWQNGSEEPVPRESPKADEEKSNPQGAEVNLDAKDEEHQEHDHLLSSPVTVQLEVGHDGTSQDPGEPEEHVEHAEHEHEVCTPPVAPAEVAQVEETSDAGQGAVDAAFVAAPSPQEVPSSALHFPVAGTGNRAVTPRRVAVRVIRTGSPMAGTQVAPLNMAYPGVSEKGWCRTPPPGPVAFVRFHPPTILEGLSANSNEDMQVKMQAQVQLPKPMLQERSNVEGWQFRQSKPQEAPLRFYPHTQRHQL